MQKNKQELNQSSADMQGDPLAPGESLASISPTGDKASIFPGGWQLIGQSWQQFKAKWKDFIKPYLFLLIPLVILIAVLAAYAVFRFVFDQSGLGASGAMSIVNVVLGLLGILALVAVIVLSLLLPLVYFFLIKHLEEKEEHTVKQLFKKASKNFWPYLFILILSALVILGGIILLIIPGIMFAVWYSMAVLVFVFEGVRGWAALKRSRQLVKHYAWTIFARLLVFQVFILVLSLPNYILQATIAYLPSQIVLLWTLIIIVGIYSLVINFIIFPLSCIYSYHIYNNLRRIKQKNSEAKSGMGFLKKLGLVLLVFLLLSIMTSFSFMISRENEEAVALRDDVRSTHQEEVLLYLEKYYETNSIYPDSLEDLTGLELEYRIDPAFDQEYFYQLSSDGLNFSFCQIFEQRGEYGDSILICVDRTGEEQILSFNEESLSDVFLE